MRHTQKNAKFKMKAVIYNKKSPNRLIYGEVEKPSINDNEVLVKIIAASINALDYRSMKMGNIPKKKIFGADISGIVELVGSNVQKFKLEDEVIGDLSDCGLGAFAEYVSTTENNLVLKPKNVSFEEASALPVAATTALRALRDKGRIKKGQSVLIVGASGGVGTYAIQLAKYYDTIITAVCSTRNVEQTKFLGADYIIDYSKEDFTKTDNRYDHIIAINGNYSLIAYKRILKPDGIYVMVGGSLTQIFKSIIFGKLMSLGSKTMCFLFAKSNLSDLEFIVKLVEEGIIKPVIEKHYSLDKTSEAMKYVKKGHSSGKVVIKVEV